MTTQPPLNDQEAERALIGAVLAIPGAASETTVKPADFYNDKHKWIWHAILDLAGDGANPDVVTIAGRLGPERLKEVGGQGYLLELVHSCPSAANYQGYADQVIKIARKREALERASKIANLAANPDTAPETLAKVFNEQAAAFSESTRPVDQPRELPPRYVVYDATEALKPRPPREWVINELVLERTLNLWVGRFGSKKSWSMLDAAICVAIGAPWLGFTTTPLKVLYVDQDMGLDNVLDYTEKCIRGHLATNDIAGRLSFTSGAGFDLWKPEDVSLLQAEIIRSGAGLVILDALRTFNPGRDENSVKDMLPVFTTLRQLITATGAAFIVSHHENKAGEFSGSTAIAGGVDSMLSVKSAEDSKFIYFKTGKKRAGKPQNFAAAAIWAGDQFYLDPADIETVKKPNQKELDVLNYLEEKGDMPVLELLAFFDRIGKTTLYKILDALVDSGKIERKNPGAPPRQPAIYGIKVNNGQNDY